MAANFAGTTARDTEIRLPRATKVKNKSAANRQITAEQILREAKEIQLEDDHTAPKQIITDPEELAEYRLKKRKEFEDLVRRVGRFNGTVWVKVGLGRCPVSGSGSNNVERELEAQVCLLCVYGQYLAASVCTRASQACPVALALLLSAQRAGGM